MTYSHYYRYKLAEDEKAVYDALEEGVRHRKVEVKTPPCGEKSLNRVLFALNFDNPDLFYVDFGSFSLLRYWGYCVFRVRYYMELAAQRDLESQVRAVLRPLLQQAVGLPPEQACMVVHDWLVRRCTYCGDNVQPNSSHNILGAFLSSSCICEGYARAYKYVMDHLRIRCTLVVGKGINPDGISGSHAWNLVKLGKNSYHVDVTFDHMFAESYCSRAYYMLSTPQILLDHSIDELFPVPECPESGSVLRTVGGTVELMQYLKDQYESGTSFTEVRLTKGFTRKRLMELIDKRMTLQDAVWFSGIRSYWYGDFSRTFLVSWR